MAAMEYTTVQTPVGPLWVNVNAGSVTSLGWAKPVGGTPANAQFGVVDELKDYFNKTLQHFDSKVKLNGTPFQQKVWNAIAKIPYGQVATYADIARRIGSHPRAVARACGQNPVPLIVPCHRVVASDGKLCGYSGGQGIATKITLLQMEGVRFTGSALQPHTVRVALGA